MPRLKLKGQVNESIVAEFFAEVSKQCEAQTGRPVEFYIKYRGKDEDIFYNITIPQGNEIVAEKMRDADANLRRLYGEKIQTAIHLDLENARWEAGAMAITEKRMRKALKTFCAQRDIVVEFRSFSLKGD
jgi:hypothetical protein